MFDSGRRLSRLEDNLAHLERTVGDLREAVAKLDPVALEQLRDKVLNAIRSLRRLAAAQEPEEAPDNGSVAPPPAEGPWWAKRR